MADQVISDLARAWPATDPDGVRLSMDQRRADALIGLLRAVRDGSLDQQPGLATVTRTMAGGGSAFSPNPAPPLAPAVRPVDAWTCPRVPVRRVHDLGLVLHADTLFGDGPAADATGQLRGLGQPHVVDPDSARALARQQLAEGTGVQVLVVDATGAVEHVVRLDRDTAEHCGSREALAAAVRTAAGHATRRWRSTGTTRPRRSPGTSARRRPPARSTTAPARPDPATSTTTPPGPAARPRSPTSTPSADATTTPRPSASCRPG